MDQLLTVEIEDVWHALQGFPRVKDLGGVTFLQALGHRVNFQSFTSHLANVAADGLVDEVGLFILGALALDSFAQGGDLDFPRLEKASQILVDDCLNFLTEKFLVKKDGDSLR